MKGFTVLEVIILIAAIVSLSLVLFPSKKGKDTNYEEFHTEDGIRCIFKKQGYGAGLSCDWSN